MTVDTPQPAGASRPDVPQEPTNSNAGLRVARVVFRLLLPVLVVAAGAAGAVVLVKTKPKPKQRKPAKAVTLVEVRPVQRSRQRVVVQAMGTVLPAQQIQLRPQVSGRITGVSQNLAPGSHFAQGEMVAQIERKDYEFALAQRQADLAQAELNYKLELGRQAIAKREWELHADGQNHGGLELELALRKPHLAQAEAAVAAAKAAVSEAELNLERTTVKAPFNAIVVAKSTDVGSEVTPQTPLATLAGTDEYWVQVSIPVDRLQWMTFPAGPKEAGSHAWICTLGGAPAAAAREGYVTRLLSDLETQGRMARVLVAVEDPLGLKSPGQSQPPLLLGAYVHVAIDGKELRDVAAIPRSALRGADKVWLMSDAGKLVIRQVEVVWSDEQTALVGRGLAAGDRLVVSDIATPVAGLEIRTAEQLNHANPAPAPQTAKEHGEPQS